MNCFMPGNPAETLMETGPAAHERIAVGAAEVAGLLSS